MVGECIMIAPVYKQNAVGRYVYLPEEMTMIRFRSLEDKDIIPLKAGHHFIHVALHEVLVFVRKDHIFFTGKGVESTTEITNNDFTFYAAKDFIGHYELLTDINQTTIITN